MYSVMNFFLYPMWVITIILLCKYNVFIVFHEIMRLNRQISLMGPNRQTSFAGPNKPLYWGWELTLVLFVTTHSQPYRYCLLWAQRALTVLKCVY